MIDKILGRFNKFFSNDVGIDLGTANTLVYLRGKGIVINDPSVETLNKKTGQVVAVGAAAKQMLGRTPSHISAVRPIVEGVISDFEVTEEMINYFIDVSQKSARRFLGPRVVIGVPSGITNVESRAVRDVAKNAGAREVFIVEQPMVADIGGGTTDIAVISLGGVVQSRNIKIAGDRFNNDIVSYARSEFKILIGEKTAEYVKIAIGSAMHVGSAEAVIKGRDLVTGLPREVTVTDGDIRDALTPSLDVLLESIRSILEITPPEIVSDIMQRGISLSGGGALLRGLDKVISEFVGIQVVVPDDPLTAVARGTGIILENIKDFEDILVKSDDEEYSRDSN